jgi:hypothetical protein
VIDTGSTFCYFSAVNDWIINVFFLLLRKHVVWSVWNRFCRRRQEVSLKHRYLSIILQGRLQVKCDGTRWRMGGEVKGKLTNGVGSQYSYTTSEHGVSSITTADAHTSSASSRLNWRPRRFKWTRPFRRKKKSGFCACAITFQLASTTPTSTWLLPRIAQVLSSKPHNTLLWWVMDDWLYKEINFLFPVI